VSVTEFDSDDTASVTISGLTSYETVTDKLDNTVFSGSTITLSAVEVNSGLTLHSSYSGSGHPVNTVTVMATNTTAGEQATTPAQTIRVTDPPANGSGGGQTVFSKGTVGVNDHADNFVGGVSGFSLTGGTSANSDRFDLVDINHHPSSFGQQFNWSTASENIGHIVMHDHGQGVTPLTMQDPGPAPKTIVETAPSQTSNALAAADNFVFNFATSKTITTDFHAHSDVHEFGEAIFANAQAILNVLHEDCHGNPAITVAGHETNSLDGVLKVHLHAADFHVI